MGTRVVFYDRHNPVRCNGCKGLHIDTRFAEHPRHVILRRKEKIHGTGLQNTFQRIVRTRLTVPVYKQCHRVTVVRADEFLAAKVTFGISAHIYEVGRHLFGKPFVAGYRRKVVLGIPEKMSFKRVARHEIRHGDIRHGGAVTFHRKFPKRLKRRRRKIYCSPLPFFRLPTKPFCRMSGRYEISNRPVGVWRRLDRVYHLAHLLLGDLQRKTRSTRPVRHQAIVQRLPSTIAAYFIWMRLGPISRHGCLDGPDEVGIGTVGGKEISALHKLVLVDDPRLRENSRPVDVVNCHDVERQICQSRQMILTMRSIYATTEKRERLAIQEYAGRAPFNTYAHVRLMRKVRCRLAPSGNVHGNILGIRIELWDDLRPFRSIIRDGRNGGKKDTCCRKHIAPLSECNGNTHRTFA